MQSPNDRSDQLSSRRGAGGSLLAGSRTTFVDFIPILFTVAAGIGALVVLRHHAHVYALVRPRGGCGNGMRSSPWVDPAAMSFFALPPLWAGWFLLRIGGALRRLAQKPIREELALLPGLTAQDAIAQRLGARLRWSRIECGAVMVLGIVSINEIFTSEVIFDDGEGLALSLLFGAHALFTGLLASGASGDIFSRLCVGATDWVRLVSMQGAWIFGVTGLSAATLWINLHWAMENFGGGLGYMIWVAAPLIPAAGLARIMWLEAEKRYFEFE